MFTLKHYDKIPSFQAVTAFCRAHGYVPIHRTASLSLAGTKCYMTN